MQPLAAGGHRVLDVTSGQQAAVADTDNAAGEHVQQDVASERERIERQDLLHTAVPVVLPREGAIAVFQGLQAGLGERNPVSLAAQIVEHLSRAAEGALGVDDPVLSTGGPKPALEGGGLGQSRQCAVEGELTRVASLDQSGPEETAAARALRTMTERKKGWPLGCGQRPGSQRWPSGASPPPGTTPCRWG